MGSITLKGREIPLIYTVFEMKQIQEEIGPLGDMEHILFGKDRRNEEEGGTESLFGTPEHLGAIAKLIRILGNAGLEERGETADLTEKWIMRALKPIRIAEAMTACMTAMNEGMASEYPEEKKNGPVDVVLEEIEKKKEQGS